MRPEHEWVAFLAAVEADRRQRATTGTGITVHPREGIMVETPERRASSVKSDVDGRILVEAVVIRLTELRPEAVGEEQELEQVCELVGGRAAENGHAQRAQRGVFQELPAQPLSLLQDLVDRARTELPERRGRTLVASWPMLPVQPIE